MSFAALPKNSLDWHILWLQHVFMPPPCFGSCWACCECPELIMRDLQLFCCCSQCQSTMIVSEVTYFTFVTGVCLSKKEPMYIDCRNCLSDKLVSVACLATETVGTRKCGDLL